MPETKTKPSIISDPTLKVLYLEDGKTVFTDNGTVLTADYQSPRMAAIINYVTQTNSLLGGKFFGKTPPVKLVSQSEIDELLGESGDNQNTDNDHQGESTEVAERLAFIMQQAVDMKGSDIHIELYENKTKIFVRVDGRRLLVGKVIPDHEYGESLFSYIFTARATEKDGSYVEHEPNNGHIEQSLLINGEKRLTKWRISYIPAKRGGKVTFRWLNSSEKIPSLDKLGWTPGQVHMFREFLKSAWGVGLIAGSTGSGKSTTLASGLSEVDESRAVHTLEDPPEFDLGVMQTQVSPHQKVSEDSDEKRGFNFFSKVLLRHDVDVEMHGEVRDHHGGMELARKGETGQLVMATLHTSSAIGIAHTLIEQFHIPKSVVAAPDLMRLWIYQTLVRTLCPHCKMDSQTAQAFYEGLDKNTGTNKDTTQWQQARTHLTSLGIKNAYYRNPHGCEYCFEGEKGRTAVIEMIVLDDDDRQYIHNEDYLGWQAALKKKGYRTVRDNALDKIRNGLIDIHSAAEKINGLLPLDVSSVYRKEESTDENH